MTDPILTPEQVAQIGNHIHGLVRGEAHKMITALRLSHEALRARAAFEEQQVEARDDIIRDERKQKYTLEERVIDLEQRATEDAATIARLTAELVHWKTCDNCGEPLAGPGICDKAVGEQNRGLELMHEETLTRAEQAEAEVARLTREREEALKKYRESDDLRRDTARRRAEEQTEAHGWKVRAHTAEAALATLREAIGVSTPWPVADVLRRLADAADHLLSDHDCDAHGWEGVGIARDKAREYASALSAPPPEDQGPRA